MDRIYRLRVQIKIKVNDFLVILINIKQQSIREDIFTQDGYFQDVFYIDGRLSYFCFSMVFWMGFGDLFTTFGCLIISKNIKSDSSNPNHVLFSSKFTPNILRSSIQTSLPV